MPRKPSRPAPARRRRALPRVPLPRQTGGPHVDKTRLPFRKQKHRKRPEEE